MTNGEYLRIQRETNQLSMATVSEKIGVTNSRLSHLENGQTKEPSPMLLKALSKIYKIDVVELFCRYGYLDKEQCGSLPVFHHTENLSEEDIKHIQQHIDYLIHLREEGGKSNGI